MLFDGYGPMSGLRSFRDYFQDHNHLKTGFIMCAVAFAVACVGGALVMAGLPWIALSVYVVAVAILIAAVQLLLRDSAGSSTAP